MEAIEVDKRKCRVDCVEAMEKIVVVEVVAFVCIYGRPIGSVKKKFWRRGVECEKSF